MTDSVNVIGGGLAGTEAAWQLAERGFEVVLYEMRPHRQTGAHVSDRLAELVCSNSLGSKLPDRASGLLQNEIRLLGSLLLTCAEKASVPAGGALAVDREYFSLLATKAVSEHPKITIKRQEVEKIPEGPTIIATGPLTSQALADSIGQLTGQDYLYFYDAIAPIVSADSIDMSIAFRASRYDRGEVDQGDYINCPLTEDEYKAFVDALLHAERVELRDFELEDPKFFERCIPIEHLAERGLHTLAYGPMRPIGLRDPRNGRRPFAVVQLRQDNLIGSLYNMVGFQTNIRWGQQEQILRMIPGLANAEFIRMGQMHRNTFINSPTLLNPTLQYRQRSDLYFAGQITGIEGYVGNIATGIVAALNLARYLSGLPLWVPPVTTMLGSLCYYITHSSPEEFQPMKANFGILPNLDQHIRNKQQRYQRYAERAVTDITESIMRLQDSYIKQFVG
jgi:methylenetetrahydrofolate--tRNA-(uracil-5-)-methyltransferase